ncbi:hypothetical protein FOZ61_003234 [Perkinsus olseni]|uniref:Mitochondrial import inner membrane translocase subunit n=1 Tax=Perkinsus olseni TaxID=32597 RepID=A0A7J6NYX6_PEROL|nr:hypothetical protein FOZ61_003234 [Perkinsus olseni]KAF4673930.1 hypothetical protein FOL46_006123 [Perkinsus olseni]KAF4689102.1 hypothetical protein FOZ60_002063 [Perkinsus olseni]
MDTSSTYSGAADHSDDHKAAQQQMMQLNMIIESQKTMVKLTGLCFDKCVSTPGKSLSNSEQTCLWRCAQNMMETNVFMQKRLVQQAKHQ